jgi:predicted component of type VI protein secretion system
MPQRHQLADTVVNGFSTDPLQALRAESLTTAGDLLSGGGFGFSASDPVKDNAINTPFMDLPPLYASPQDNNNDSGVSPEGMAQRHLATTPLLRGLGSSLAVRNSRTLMIFWKKPEGHYRRPLRDCLNCNSVRAACQISTCARWRITRSASIWTMPPYWT